MSTYVCNTPIPESEQRTLSLVNGVISSSSNDDYEGGSAIKNNDKFHQQQQNLLLDDITNSSIIEFLNQENQCYNDNDTSSEIEIETIFEEINRLSGGCTGDNGGFGVVAGYNSTDPLLSITADVNVEDILKEAERLITKQAQLEIPLSAAASTAVALQQCSSRSSIKVAERMNMQQQKTLSSESTPREMKKGNDIDKVDNQV